MSGAADPLAAGRRGILFVVSAPSGAGKTTLVKAALDADPALSLSVSCTTRTPRAGEQDGRDYFFVDPSEFGRRRDDGDFVEWAQVFDHFYATPRGPLDAAIAAGRDVLLDVDIQGARAITKTYPADAVGIFVVPPSFAVLEQRLRARGTDSDAQIKRRLDRVREEIAAGRDTNVYDFLIVNEDREHAVRDLMAVIAAERCRLGRRAPSHLD
jgi:guanylate kinase